MIDRDKSRKNLIKYTRRALDAIPGLENPLILDIGCGSGLPAITIAKATGGKVIGIDNDRASLDKFKSKLQSEAASIQVEVFQANMLDLHFDENTFDVIWAEGSIAVIGFEQGLKAWKKLLKSPGYMVIHDDAEDLDNKKRLIAENGFELLDSFMLYENIWWDEYYAALEKQIGEHYLDGGLPIEGEALEVFKEIEMYRATPERFRSVYFIIRKK
jgi:SAM-dependent methyltransferase